MYCFVNGENGRIMIRKKIEPKSKTPFQALFCITTFLKGQRASILGQHFRLFRKPIIYGRISKLVKTFKS